MVAMHDAGTAPVVVYPVPVAPRVANNVNVFPLTFFLYSRKSRTVYGAGLVTACAAIGDEQHAYWKLDRLMLLEEPTVLSSDSVQWSHTLVRLRPERELECRHRTVKGTNAKLLDCFPECCEKRWSCWPFDAMDLNTLVHVASTPYTLKTPLRFAVACKVAPDRVRSGVMGAPGDTGRRVRVGRCPVARPARPRSNHGRPRSNHGSTTVTPPSPRSPVPNPLI